MRWFTPAAAALAIALVLAACARGAPNGNGLEVLSPGQLPTGSPGGATGNLESGTAMIDLTGDVVVNSSIDRLGAPAVYDAPPGGMALQWTDVQHGPDALAISGPTFVGERPTSAGLRLQLTVRSPVGTLAFVSRAGECRITVTKARPHTFAGTFICRGLSDDSGHTVDAAGTFTASG